MRRLGLFSKGPSNQYNDLNQGESDKSIKQVRFANDKSLLHEAEIAEQEGRIEDAQLIRRKIGD
jgi:hypothetical protein